MHLGRRIAFEFAVRAWLCSRWRASSSYSPNRAGSVQKVLMWRHLQQHQLHSFIFSIAALLYPAGIDHDEASARRQRTRGQADKQEAEGAATAFFAEACGSRTGMSSVVVYHRTENSSTVCSWCIGARIPSKSTSMTTGLLFLTPTPVLPLPLQSPTVHRWYIIARQRSQRPRYVSCS